MWLNSRSNVWKDPCSSLCLHVAFVAISCAMTLRSRRRRAAEGRSEHRDHSRIKRRWEKEQESLRRKLVECDDMKTWSWHHDKTSPQGLKFVGGVDISFVKNDPKSRACACLVVLRFPSMEIVYKCCKMIQMDEPYISGFLAFRECHFLVELIEELRETREGLMPQVIIVDGNGVLHPRGFGLACHLGVLMDIPTIGIGKSLLFVDGLTKESVRNEGEGSIDCPLIGDSGKVWGHAGCFATGTTKPIFVSVGHRVSLETALRVVRVCSHYRIPEPVRRADLLSRNFIRNAT